MDKTTKTILIILVILLVIAGIGFWLYTEQKKKKKIKIGYPNPKSHSNKGNQKVMEVQKYLNTLLPPDYPKLVVDGIWGPKTQAAWEYVKSKKIDKKQNETLNNLAKIAVTANPILGSMVVGSEIMKKTAGKVADWFEKLF